MFALFKKEIMIVVFMAISFLLGSFGSSEAVVEPQEELRKEKDKGIFYGTIFVTKGPLCMIF